MRCRWWNLWIILFCLVLPISVSTGCGNAQMSQEEANQIDEEEEIGEDIDAPLDEQEQEAESSTESIK